jgi:NTE family protein
LARRRLGIALGGGGARGFAHLGILLVLEEYGIPIDVVAGTSMGAAVGCAKALGISLHKLTQILGSLDLNVVLQISESTLREMQRAIGRGMVEYVRGPNWKEAASGSDSLQRLIHLFRLLTGNRGFSDILLPFAAVAADVETGQEVVITEGNLAQAVAASAAIPGVFAPVFHDGHYLIDGGVLNKVPVDAVIDLGAEAVIAVDAGAPVSRDLRTSLDVLLQSQRIASAHLTTLQLERARRRVEGRLLVLRPAVEDITMLSFERLPEAVEAGKDAARAHLAEIRALLEESG